jgi:hypothetical protein
MAKIVVGRLPQATKEYDPTQFDILIRELDNVVTQLNFAYEQQNKDETLARSWYLG